jgi:hypothetical protein
MKFAGLVDHEALPEGIRVAYFNLIQALWKHGTLDAQLKELIRMRSAMLADCKQ